MTPKSLLRHPKCTSAIDEFTNIDFQEIIDSNQKSPEKITKVLFCSGKIYYDLLEKKETDDATHIAIVRIEQLYPLAEKMIQAIVTKYKNANFVWVQEEPKNMGAYTFLTRYDIFENIKCISRKSSASPATGFKKVHDMEQEQILTAAFS